MTHLEQIQQLEERLRQAMLTSDVAELDGLLADDLLAAGPDGRLMGKADDLAAHRAGSLRLTGIVPQETTIKLLPDVALVFVVMALQGTFGGQPFAGPYRYTRVWRHQRDGWQVIAAHISAVPSEQPDKK